MNNPEEWRIEEGSDGCGGRAWVIVDEYGEEVEPTRCYRDWNTAQVALACLVHEAMDNWEPSDAQLRQIGWTW